MDAPVSDVVEEVISLRELNAEQEPHGTLLRLLGILFGSKVTNSRCVFDLVRTT